MRRLAIAVLLLLTGCAHPVAPVLQQPAPLIVDTIVDTPAPILYISNSLQADAQLCVSRELFRYAGAACITVGELRTLLRSRGDVAASGVTR